MKRRDFLKVGGAGLAASAVAAPAIVFLLGPHLVTWLNGIGFVLTF